MTSAVMSGTRLLHLAAHFDSLKPIREFILESAHSAGLGQESSGELLLAVDESCHQHRHAWLPARRLYHRTGIQMQS
jgi:hypothetical protein